MVKVVAQEDLKRPQSAYWLWLSANREKIAQAAGTSKGSEVSKKGGEMWKTVSDAEKKPFEEEAKRQKEKYEAYLKTPEGEAAKKALQEERKEAKIEDVKKAQKKAAKGVEKEEGLKKPQTAYWLWLSANREKIAQAAGTSKGSEVSKKGGEMWKTISDAEKKPFEEEAKQQKERYEAFLKTPEGSAAMQQFKAAQKEAKAEVKGAGLVEGAKGKRKAEDLEDRGASSPPGKARKGKVAAGPAPPRLDEAVKAKADEAGLTAPLLQLAARQDVKESGKSDAEILQALEKSGGLLHPAKRALLGA